MTYLDNDPIAEVRRNRELLLEEHGGIEGLIRHMEEERPKLEQQGWKFTTFEELAAKKRKEQEQLA